MTKTPSKQSAGAKVVVEKRGRKALSGRRSRSISRPVTKRLIAPNLQALVNAIGTTRDTYTRYRYHPKAPARLHDGYDIEAWRAFFREQAITTNTDRREGMAVSELKAEILHEDLDMRRMEKARMRGLLIDRAEADERLVTMATIFVNDLSNLKNRIDSVARDGKIALHEVQLGLDECLSNVRRQIQSANLDQSVPQIQPESPARQ